MSGKDLLMIVLERAVPVEKELSRSLDNLFLISSGSIAPASD
jgi:hypothetical protein